MTEESTPGKTYCPACGSPIAGDHRFCENCGAPVPAVPVAEPKPPVDEIASDPVAAPAQPAAQPVEFAEATQQPTEPTEGSKQPDTNAVSGMAIVSLILGILSILFSLFFVGLILGIVAIVLAIVARKRSKNGISLAGLITGIVGTVFSALVIALVVVVVALVANDADIQSDIADIAPIETTIQQESSIVGPWNIVEAEIDGDLVVTEDTADQFKGDITLVFNSDDTFDIDVFGEEYTGDWYDYGYGVILLITDDGDFYDVEQQGNRLTLTSDIYEGRMVFEKD